MTLVCQSDSSFVPVQFFIRQTLAAGNKAAKLQFFPIFLLLMNKSQLEEESKHTEATFFTQIRERRPTTSHISRNKTQLTPQLSLDPELDPTVKLKFCKEEIKKLESEYQLALTRLHESEKVIGRNYRDSQKKKVQFLNLYEHRKLQLLQLRLLESKEQEQEKCKAELREKAKTMKLSSDIRSLLIRHELEENISQLCLNNKRDRRNLRQQIVIKREIHLEQARKSYSRVKAAQQELQLKRKRVEQVQLAVARQNHFKKVQKELQAIQHIDQRINLSFDSTLCSNCAAPGPSSFFVTDKTD